MIDNKSYWKELIIAYLSDVIEEVELEKLTVWLKTSQEHIDYFQSIEKTWFVSSLVSAPEIFPPAHGLMAFSYKVMREQRGAARPVFKLKSFLKYASILIFGILTTLGYQYLSRQSDGDQRLMVVEIPKGARGSIVLPDGSKVMLNAESRLEFPNVFKENAREVKLYGEGYFEVAKDATRVFTVTTGDTKVNVLGTEFNLKNYNSDNSLTLTLFEGSVELQQRSNEPVKLTPNQVAVLDKRTESIELLTDSTNTASTWMGGKLLFNVVMFADIVTVLERKFDVEIKVHDAKLMRKTFVGEFVNGETIEQILNVITANGAHHYTIKGNAVDIY